MSADIYAETWPAEAVTYRDPALVRGILEYIAEAADQDRKPGWLEMVDTFTTEERNFKTVENTLYELTAFGAIRRHGRPAGRGGHQDTRSVQLTHLGRYWLTGRTPPPLIARSQHE